MGRTGRLSGSRRLQEDAALEREPKARHQPMNTDRRHAAPSGRPARCFSSGHCTCSGWRCCSARRWSASTAPATTPGSRRSSSTTTSTPIRCSWRVPAAAGPPGLPVPAQPLRHRRRAVPVALLPAGARARAAAARAPGRPVPPVHRPVRPGVQPLGFSGLLLSWRVARRLYPERAATLAAVTLWLGSPLLFYMIPNNFLSHSIDVFVNALFLYIYTRTRGPERPRTWLGYGLLIGLAMMVRMPNIFLGIIPLTESVARLRAGERRLGPEAARYLPLAAGLLVAMTPQMLVWKLTRGHWFLLNPYKGATHDTSDFLHPHLWQVLFSTNHGFLLWAPAFLLALLSLPLLARRDRRLTVGLVLSGPAGLLSGRQLGLLERRRRLRPAPVPKPHPRRRARPERPAGPRQRASFATAPAPRRRLPDPLDPAADGPVRAEADPLQHRRPRVRPPAQPAHPDPRPLRPPPPCPRRPPPRGGEGSAWQGSGVSLSERRFLATPGSTGYNRPNVRCVTGFRLPARLPAHRPHRRQGRPGD